MSEAKKEYVAIYNDYGNQPGNKTFTHVGIVAANIDAARRIAVRLEPQAGGDFSTIRLIDPESPGDYITFWHNR